MWVLIFGVSLASVSITRAAGPVNAPSDIERFCNPPSGPARPCPQIAPVGSEHLRSAQEQEKHMKEVRENNERMMREEEAQALTRPPQPAPQTGIIAGDTVQERFGAGYPFGVENAWVETLNGREVTVYAGAMSYDPATQVNYDPLTVHGFVIIQTGELGEPNAREKQLYTPTAVGSLHIIAAKGNVLTLQSRQGNKFLLNVETEQLTPLGRQ
jgi:hypothetical protein